MIDLERLVRESGKPHRRHSRGGELYRGHPEPHPEGPGPDLQAGHPGSHRSGAGVRGQAGQEGGLTVVVMSRVAALVVRGDPGAGQVRLVLLPLSPVG